jgi:hypothetical protein
LVAFQLSWVISSLLSLLDRASYFSARHAFKIVQAEARNTQYGSMDLEQVELLHRSALRVVDIPCL